MEPRIDISKVDPKAYQAMFAFGEYLRHSGLEAGLVNLIVLRASQINRCAYCIDMHTKDARAAGETEQRLYCLDAWEESPFYSDRERAALAWTEAVTLVSESHVPDEVYEEVKKQFSEKEIVSLTMAIVAINGWNRLNIATRTIAGSYQPPKHPQTAAQKSA